MPICSNSDSCWTLNDVVIFKDAEPRGKGSIPGRLKRKSASFTAVNEHHNSHIISWAGGTWTPGVLGQGYASPGVPRKLMNSLGTLTSSSQSPFSPVNNSHHLVQMGGSLKSIPASIPKTPRPNKARQAFEALIEGLKACVLVAEEEIGGLKEGVREMSISDGQSMLQGRIYEMEKTAKITERTLKKLEYQLSRVEELAEQYSLQQRLREGVRAMAYAFSISEGKERDTALANVKAGFKECTDVLCSLEGQLEAFLGTFKMTMKGIQGFARLCPGDVFEITIKHGIQKWKTRGKVGKDGTQTWDFPRATFRAVLGEVMYIKAAEVKTLGKQVLLGNKFCEAKELFSSHPQLMTVNLNPSGSLKLNIIVTWCPLDYTEDYIHGGNAGASASPSRKRRLSPTTPDMTLSSNSSTVTMQSPSLNTIGSVNSRSTGIPLWERTLESIDDSIETSSFRFSSLTGSKSARLQSKQDLLSKSTLNSDPTGNFSLKKRDTNEPERVALKPKETTVLEDNELDGLIHSRNGVMLIMDDDETGESIKTLKDSILKLISFLEDIKGQWPELENLEDYLGELEKMIHEIIDPKMTARTTDSGISSLGGHTHSRSPSPARSAGSPSIPLVTGNAQLDLALETHINLCLLLVQNLGSFGPLKTREHMAVSKLVEQGGIIGKILKEAKHPMGRGKLVELAAFPTLQLLWERITDTTSHCPLVTTADMAVHGLELEIRPVVNYKHPKEAQLSNRVAKILAQAMLDTGSGDQMNPSAVLTVFQFQLFLLPHQNTFYKLVEQLADEELLQARLQGESHEVVNLVKSLGERLPPKKVLMSLIRWLISPEKDAASAVREYIQDLSCIHTYRLDLITTAEEMLESDWNLDRESACLLLSVLEVTNAIEQLAYLAQSDPTPQVRNRAKESLLSLGQDRILEQLTLSTHGFQGLAVN